MIPEIGHFSLIIGLAFAMLLASVPWIGAEKKDAYLVRYAWPLAYGMFFFILISVITLGYSFAVDDFSVAYVAHHSNSQLPIFFKIAAVWGGHEGSLLFWVFSLSVWAAAVATFSKGCWIYSGQFNGIYLSFNRWANEWIYSSSSSRQCLEFGRATPTRLFVST